MQNLKKARITNKSSGLLGVCFDKKYNKYVASIKINYKTIGLGSFKTAQEAHEAYLKAKRELHPFGTI